MLRLRPLAALLSLVIALCLLGLWSASSQTGALRRVTNTTEDGININPSLSGDGRRIAFESTKDLAGAGGNGFHAIRADLTLDPATFVQMGLARAPAPGISQDGSIIAFAAKENPLGTNADGNSEIFLYDGATLRQITSTTPNDISTRVRDGNFQPSLSDDGRFIAFSSNRNLATQNADGNLEIFVFDTIANTFAQLTSTAGTTGASDAKISGDGTRVAYIRDTGAQPSAQRNLILQDRLGGTTRVLAANVTNLALTYGRAISDDGSRVVYSGDVAANDSELFLFDGRTTNATRQITALGERETEVPLHPTISGDGTRIAFATRRPITITVGDPEDEDNSDRSIEVYTYDIPTGQFARVTPDAPSNADGFSGSTRLMEVVSSLNDDGSMVAFNFPRALSGEVETGFENNSEIYVTGTAPRPATGSLTILNEASFGHELETIKGIAPESRAVALGGALAFNSVQAQPQGGGTYPTSVDGTTVTVNGRPAQIFYVSPTQVNFYVPPQTELGTATVVVTNAEGFQSRGTVTVFRASPGIFTESGDGTGKGVVLNADMTADEEFDPSSGQLRLIIFTTGVRKALQVTATAGGRALTVESYMASADMLGMDEVRVLVPADLRGAGTVNLIVRADDRDSNPVTITFGGDSCRDILINEVLADPPDGAQGDANRDGVRSVSQDEFVELVNRSGRDIDISGYQLLTRSTTAASDTVRHTFASGTIFPAGSAIVIFGGWQDLTFDANNPAFGGARVLKASSGGLSLTNSGGSVTLRDASQSIVNIFSYGGSTGLNGDANQSLTRTEDAGTSANCTGFTLHSTAPGGNGQPFSPGTRNNGMPFTTVAIARIEVSPPTATIDAGAKQQFTARAFDANNVEISGVIFFWESSNTAVATIDQTGLATSSSPGTTEIRASARGVQSAPAVLTVRAIERILTSITVSPNPATIPVGGTQQFTAQGFDQFGNEITGLTFTWESTSTAIATIDPATGLATGVSAGQTTIRATSQSVTGTATLNVTPPTVVINEVLADPPDTDGDANRDGTRSGTDDEFVELVNSTGSGINISGWTLRTRATNSTTETSRHTFAANTSLPAGEAIVVFGGAGANFDPANAAFACAQVVTASSGGLSLTNSGLTIIVRDSAGNLVAQFTYGTGTGLAADNNQSLTRSPDITGSFVQHLAATGAGPRRFSPGTRTNGAPFGSCPARLTSITISPPSSSVLVGQTTQFTAQAFDQFGQPIIGATITFASDNTTVATIESVTTDPNTGITTATVRGQTAGTALITAQATDGTTTVTSSASTLTVNASTPTYVITGQVRDASNNPISDVLITFEKTFQSTVTTQTTTTDANGNYSSGDLGCQNNVKVTPSKTGFTFTPSAISFVNSSQCLSGSDVANFTGAPPPPGTLVISQLYVAGGNANATYTNDFVEIFNSGTTTVDFSLTPYSVQFAGTGVSFGSTAANSKTNITSGTIAPGQYFLVQEASGGAVGAALPTPDATGTINLLSAGGKVALVVGTTALPALTCPGDDGASPFNPSNPTISDFVGYGGNANTAGHCYEGPAPAPAPTSTNADFRKAGGCVDTNFNADDFLVAAPNPRNTSSPLNDCSVGLRPEITINDPSAVSESTANATFTVTLSVPSTLTVTVDYATANGTATAGADYQSTSGTLTFAPGETTKSILVPIINDTTDELAETFFVNLTNATNGVILDNQGQGTINDNDNPPTLSINDTSVTEGDSATASATFTVTLSAASGQTVTVNYATADNTATAGSDYQSTNGTLTFNPGQTTQTLTVLVNGDTTFEPDETFFVNLTTPVNATISDTQGQGTITNDDAAPPVPAITIDNISVTEGDSGTKTVDFTVSLSMNPTTPVTVDYATASAAPASGVATAGTDYQPTSGTLTFNPGETSKPVTVTIIGDTTVEPDETFFVNLSNASANAVLIDPQGTGTITNDDAANLVISQVYGGGGNSGATYTHDFIEIFNRGTTTVNFAITPYSVQYAGATSNFSTNLTVINSGTIAPGQYFLIQEFSPSSPVGIAPPTPDAVGTINLAVTGGKVALVSGTAAVSNVSCPGDDLSTMPTNPSGNNIVDFLGYGSASCYEGTGPATAHSNTTADFRKGGGCVDTNDNAADFLVFAPNPRNSSSPVNNCTGGVVPNLTISDATVTEGNAGTVTATFTVQLSAPAQGADVTFDIATQNNTALSGSDYVAKSQTSQVIPAGQQTYTFTVVVNGDTVVEPDETFFVNVTNVTGANVTDGQGTGTIQNDDLPSLSINDVAQNEGNTGTTTFTFTVSLSAPASSAVTFDIATADVTAQDGTPSGEDNDYVAKSLTAQTIPAGSQMYTFDVTVNGDTSIEPNETFSVNVTNVSGATISDGQGVGTIQNDDSPPTLSIGDVTQAEGNSGTTTFTFTVQLSSAALAGGVTFDIATQDDTALAGSDYVANSLTSQTIPEGSQTYTFDVTVNGDTIFEPNETFFVNVTNVTGATLSDGQAVGTITNDDAQPTITIADASVTEGNAGTSLMTFTVTLTGTSPSTVSVNYATVDSSATTADSDYATASGTLNFVSGDTSETFTVTINGDTNAEGDEMFLVNLSGASGATITDNQALGTIFLDDPFSIAALNTAYSEDFNVLAQSGVSSTTPAAWTRAESGTSANTTYTANNGGSNTGDTYSYGSAALPSDRALGGLRTGSLVPTFGAFFRNDTGSTINTLQIAYTGEEWRLGTASRTDRLDFQYSTDATSLTTGTWTDADALDFTTPNTTGTGAKDGNDAANRTALSNTITGLNIAPGATVWIRWTDLDASGADDGLAVDDFSITAGINLPALSISDVSQVEGNSGQTNFIFTVSLTSPAPAGGVSFTINTADGTTNPATAGSDYEAITNGSGSIAQNSTSTTVSVNVNGDVAIEPDETFFVNITNVTGATLSDGQGLGTIQNDDSPSLSISDVIVTEGTGASPTLAQFTVTLTGASTQTVTVNYATADGTATAGSDYTATSGTLTFNPGDPTTQTITVNVTADSTAEALNQETFFVNLSGATNATIADPQGQGTITDDENKLVISQIYGGGNNSGATFQNDFVELFNRGTTPINFAVTAYSVQYASAAGTFSSGNTINLTSGTIAPGQYFLIKLAPASPTIGTALPTADATNTAINMSATDGKVALVIGTVVLSGSGCPIGATVADFIGYGSANCAEGTATGALNATRSARRTNSCVDTNNNSADFTVVTNPSAPRNSVTTPAPCP